ncbi:replication factor A protein 2 [Entomortierella chlamydospora]|nr:replication factor A protein 2 [Entomortierella chlamydospora]
MSTTNPHILFGDLDYKPYSHAGQGQGYVQESFSSDVGATKRIANHTLRPVTIKQLLSVTQTQADNDFRIDGHDLGQVTFIATVRNINQQSTQHTYTVEDGTGTIDAKRFPTEDEDSAELNTIVVGTTVRIVGILKSYNQKFSINIHAIRPIHDMNELTHHLLEVIYVHVSSTRSKGAGGMSMSSAPHNNFASHSMANVGNVGAGSGVVGEDIPEQISEMIRNHSDAERGVPRHEIIARFGQLTGGPEAANELINAMVSEGALYTGEDEDHILVAY